MAATGAALVVVDATKRFLEALAGVADPEEKRKIIGREFIRSSRPPRSRSWATPPSTGERVEFLVQGTLYPDVVESGGGAGTFEHQVPLQRGAGCPDDLEFELVEPPGYPVQGRRSASSGIQLGLAPGGSSGGTRSPALGLAIRIHRARFTHERLETPPRRGEQYVTELFEQAT